MGIYYGVGNTVVPAAEYLEHMQLGTFVARRGKTIDISDTSLDLAKIADEITRTLGQPWTPIEYGKPLVAEIRWYTQVSSRRSRGGRRPRT